MPDSDVFYDTPTVIFEVVSPSSETTDHREKQLINRHIPPPSDDGSPVLVSIGGE